MELAGILLVTCVLVLSAPSASAESGQLVLRHDYPGNNTNFRYIELVCLHEDPESPSLAMGAAFQLNGTDIEEELNVIDIGGDGTIYFILTPEKESFFTCSLNGSMSYNAIGLAVQPSSDYTGLSRPHQVELPDADSEVLTELQCDIQPGALRQRYSVLWKQIFNDSYIIANEGMFNLTLSVGSSLNGSQYQCEVTIDHDGSIIRSYDGVLTTLVTTSGAAAETGQLVLRHGYPETDTNFSYIALICIYEDESHRFIKGAAFQLNGTDIEEEFNVTDIGDGSVAFILTPEKEGFFTCSVNGTVSNNSIGLAAQPSTNYSGQSRSHEVELPDADSKVPTELQCDIQPGALTQRYSVLWKQILNDSYIIANKGRFNLTLNVSSSLNGFQYQCEVTIDHDGSNIQSYDGVWTTLIIATGTDHPQYFTVIIVAPLVTTSVLLMVITVITYNCKKKSTHPTRVGMSTHNEHDSQHLISHHPTELQCQLDDFPDIHTHTQNIGNLTEEVSIDSRDIAILLDEPVSLTENVSPVLHPNPTDRDSGFNTMPQPEEQVNVEPLQTSALETPPCHVTRHVTASGMDQYTRDNELHPVMTSVATAIEREDHQNIAGRYSEKVLQATPQPENPFLPRYSADPYNTADHIPKWMKPVATVKDCTSDGRSYYDEHNDFRLEIPEGAIPEGERITIDIGVALYGPFQYPEGLRPASPVFWVCVRDWTNLHFLKPVTVTIPHCLNLENAEDVQSLGMTFLKGDHDIDRERNYKLKKYNDSLHVGYTFEPGKKCAVLYTRHFCMLCIGCNDNKFYENVQFCITSYIPCPLKFPGHTFQIFFITFLLNTCRETVHRHIADGKFPEIGENHREVVKNFQFAKRDSQCEDLRIVLPTSQALPRGWNLGEEFNTPINVRDIDFFVHDERIEELRQKQDAGLYPPLFRVKVSLSTSAEEGTAQIRFEGATEELKIDISFVRPPSSAAANAQSPTSSFASNISRLRLSSSVGSDTSLSNPPDLSDLLSEVADNIPTKWERVGTQLRLEYSQLQTFKCDDPLDSFSKVFDAWQRQCNAPNTLPYTWESMIDVLRRVKEHALANALLEKLR